MMIADSGLMKGARHKVQGAGHLVKRDGRSDGTSKTRIFSRQEVEDKRMTEGFLFRRGRIRGRLSVVTAAKRIAKN
jgi:hypothetical protein